MPYLVYTEQALRDFRRLREFLLTKNPRAAGRAGQVLLGHLNALESTPDIGRPVDGLRRELVIPFSNAGYIALYEYDAAADIVVVQTIRHQSEQN